MKIIITSMGRAHLLDSARELQKLGHDVTFLCSTHIILSKNMVSTRAV